MFKIEEIVKSVASLPRYTKRVIAILADIGLCTLCIWFSFYLRLGEFITLKDLPIVAVLFSIISALSVFWMLGLYREIFRYPDLSIIFSTLAAISIYGLIYFPVIGIYGIQGVPRSIGIIHPMVLFFMIISSRLLVKYLFSNSDLNRRQSISLKKVLVYGAGIAGRQIAISLENSNEFKVIGFLDDDKQLQRRVLIGKTIYAPSKVEHLIESKGASLVILAFPSINRSRRNQIIDYLSKYKITVKTLPSVDDIVGGRVSLSDIKDLNINDLLNREQVIPNYQILSQNINSKTILVTGAGGSIGSELCRQIMKLNPKKLIILELNEFALYKIYEELILINKNSKVIPLLSNIQDEKKLDKIFNVYNIDTVYHAAAYKHVPLVEENIYEGIKNNVFGTLAITRVVINHKVDNFVFISSDKAVRPTNIMGATKRLAEICVKSLYEENSSKLNSKFSIVRFGNVLESSGSVIPKFKKQIEKGGPITLTHPDVTRYFMTTTEAAQLVIQAGAMSEKCEIFLLDMGESVKIIDLIYKMIKLSGFTVRDSKNLDGDIEIKIIGLRPGEKLYEELLIGDNPKKTTHKKIKKAHDTSIPSKELNLELKNLDKLLNENNISDVKSFLKKIVKSYKSNSEIIDHLYLENLALENQENKVINIKQRT